jgi:hypothetical protein
MQVNAIAGLDTGDGLAGADEAVGLGAGGTLRDEAGDGTGAAQPASRAQRRVTAMAFIVT